MSHAVTLRAPQGLGMLTPHDVHHGLAETCYAHRTVVLREAYIAHPEHFVQKSSMPTSLLAAAWIINLNLSP